MNNKGFTLVELSIVLVIISLIVAGVVGGRSLIRSAEIKTVVDDINKFQTAINVFRDQYDAYPGDMRDASAYWPGCDSPATNCDGDGNNIIDIAAGESLRAVQILTLAEITGGTYSGQAVGGGFGMQIGTNSPESSINGGAYYISYAVPSAQYPDMSGHTISLGKIYTTDNSYSSGIIKASEAKILDKKMDDGVAGTGRFTAKDGGDSAAASCVTAGSPAGYILSQVGADCALTVQID